MSDTTWTYHVVLGADVPDRETNTTRRGSVIEVGPFPTADAALRFAAENMGRTATGVLDGVTDWLIDEGPDVAPSVDWLNDEHENSRLVGYTIERYDGEQTDGSWSINGGLRASILAAAAA